jgi:hypothetical protein
MITAVGQNGGEPGEESQFPYFTGAVIHPFIRMND